MVVEKQTYPNHAERYINVYQVLCEEGLTEGRFYWEVNFNGSGTFIGVTYKTKIEEKQGWDAMFGLNNKSWGILCNEREYTFCHNKARTIIYLLQSQTVGVYLDWPAGTLSFYSVKADRLTLLHTTNQTFTEPLYPAFGFKTLNSTVSLCLMN